MRAVTALLARIEETIERHRMLARGQRVGVAVSGGADSVGLLHALLELRPKWGLELVVLHVNHGLRGEESRQDAEFVCRLAEQLRLPFCLRELVDLPGSPGNLEQAARHARLAFFREVTCSGQVDRVAVGHTRSDQAETVLFRFLRGSGTAGLAGIRPATASGVIRPLLEVSRAEMERFLRERAIPWREDSSNASLQFARNRIRHGLLPLLTDQWNPRLHQALANTADWAAAEEAYWETEIGRLAAGLLLERGGAVFVRAGSLAELPLAAARRMVRRAIDMAKGDTRGVDFHHIAAVVAMASSAQGSGRAQVPGLDIIRSFDWLRFAKPGTGEVERGGYQVPVTVPGTTRVPGTEIAICLELIEKSETSGSSHYVYNNDMGCLNWRSLSGSLELRNWRPGDQYQPVGSTSKEKIKILFQQARIPLWDRRNWPILTDGASIVWARRFGAAVEFAAGSAAKVILTVRESSAG